MAEIKKRKDGYYWCMRGGEWNIYWYSSHFKCWFSMFIVGSLNDADFQNIDEEKLKHKH